MSSVTTTSARPVPPSGVVGSNTLSANAHAANQDLVHSLSLLVSLVHSLSTMSISKLAVGFFRLIVLFLVLCVVITLVVDQSELTQPAQSMPVLTVLSAPTQRSVLNADPEPEPEPDSIAFAPTRAPTLSAETLTQHANPHSKTLTSETAATPMPSTSRSTRPTVCATPTMSSCGPFHIISDSSHSTATRS